MRHGHRHIAAVMGTTAATPSRERLAGCREAVEAVDGARLRVYEGELQDAVGAARTMGLGERLVLNLLERGRDRPTAVFCANNLLTQGALRAVRRSGHRVPDDLAIVGFDDLPFFELIDPPLTVAAQPTEELGRLAAEVLFERISDPERPVEAVVVDPEIQIRASCGPHPEQLTAPSRG